MTARFESPDESADGWVDVRMTDPDVGEWEIDAVVMDGRVEYVDLRIKPELLAGFVACLLGDVDDERASATLSRVRTRRGLDAETVGAADEGEADDDR
jgi:hypothetical protein